MSDPDAAFLEDFGFFFINVHDVGGNDVVAEYAEMVKPAHRAHAVSGDAVLPLFFRFGCMKRERLTVGFGGFGAAL